MATNLPKSSGKKSALIVSASVMGSRLMGLVRDQVFAYMFGATILGDVFQAAFRIPNLLRDLFAEGALSTAFTTTFTKLWAKDGSRAAWHLGEVVLSVLILVMGGLCLAGVFLSPLIVWVFNPGFSAIPGKYEMTVTMTRVLFPFILFVSLAAVVMGMLNSRNIFGIPASASTVFNLVSVLSGVIFALILEPQADWHHPHFGELSLYGMCLGVLLGGLAQLGMQLPSVWKLGFRFGWRPDFQDPRFRTVMALMLPSVIAGSAVQVNILVNSQFASFLPGAPTWLTFAFRFVQLPIGIFGVAIATVTLPAVARQHALEDLKAFGETVEEALRFGFYLTLPSSIGLVVIAQPLITLIYQRGAFDAHAAHETALALQAFTIGLAGYSGLKILVPCFFALNETHTPMRVSFMGMGLNLVLNGLLFFGLGLGHVGLALTTGLVAVLNFLQLIYAIQKKIYLGRMEDWISFFLRVTLAALGCGLVAWVGLLYLWPLGGTSSLLCLILLLTDISLAGLVYLGLTLLFRVPESLQLLRFLRRKLGR